MAPNIRLWKRDAPPEGGDETEGGDDLPTPTPTMHKVHFGVKHHTTATLYPPTTPVSTESDLCKFINLFLFLLNYNFIVYGFECKIKSHHDILKN